MHHTNHTSKNIILNKEQLTALKYFIEKKGFQDQSVMLEIFDHLACKIEEIWTENPNLSFEQATTLAHQSFGVMGFRNLERGFNQSIEKRYRKQYKIEAKRLFTSVHILGVMLISVFSAQVFHVLSFYPNSFLFQFTFATILLGIFLWLTTKRIRISKKSGNSIFMQMSNSFLYLEFTYLWLYGSSIITFPNMNYIFLGLTIFINTIAILLGYRMKDYAKKDHEQVKKQMQKIF